MDAEVIREEYLVEGKVNICNESFLAREKAALRTKP